MKQGVQESRYPVSLSHGYSQIGDETGVTKVEVLYPISLTHGYSQIGDETGSTRVKVPNTTAQRHDDVMENYLFICKMFRTLKKAPGVLHKKYPKEVLETCKERKRCL
jgi:predicted nucleotide-binding protein (sugar kinase/HSP70/actin superfamily)